MIFLFRGQMQKTLKKRRKQAEGKYSKMKRKKNEEYMESQITTINIFDFTFFIKKLYFAQKYSSKKQFLSHHILLTVFMRYRVFKTQ